MKILQTGHRISQLDITTAFQVTTASSNTSLGVHQAQGQSIFSGAFIFSGVTSPGNPLKIQHPLDVCKLDILVPLIGYSPNCCGSFHDRSTKQRSPAGKGGLHGLAHAMPGAITKNGSIFLDRCFFQPLWMNGETALMSLDNL